MYYGTCALTTTWLASSWQGQAALAVGFAAVWGLHRGLRDRGTTLQQFQRLRLKRIAGRRPYWCAEVYEEVTGRYRVTTLFRINDPRARDPYAAEDLLRDAWKRVQRGKHPTRTQATLRAAEAYKERNTASLTQPGTQTLRRLIELDQGQRTGRRGRPRSIATMNDLRRILRKFVTFIEERYPNLPLPMLAAPHIEPYFEKRTDDGVSYGTRRRELAAVRSMFTLGVKRGWIVANPCTRIEMAAPTIAEERQSRRERALKDHEIDALLRACHEPYEYRGTMLRRGKRVSYVGDKQPPIYLKPFVLVAARCGPRRGELLRSTVKDSSGSVHQYPGLRCEDIDWRTHRFHVRGKTGPRPIPMSREVEEALRGLRKLQMKYGHNEGHVFLDDSGTPVEDPSRAFSSAVRRAAIGRHVRVHDLRHTALTDLAKKGVPPSVIQKTAGHSSLQVTSLYANPDEDYVVAEFRRAYSS